MTAFTPTRIVALVLLAFGILGLAYLRFARDHDPVSVPSGAQAGDLILENCEYSTEAGSYDAECGTLVVPEYRDRPGLATNRAAGVLDIAWDRPARDRFGSRHDKAAGGTPLRPLTGTGRSSLAKERARVAGPLRARRSRSS